MKKRPKWSWNSQLLPILNKLFLQLVSFIWANSSFHLSHFFTVDNKFACVEGYSSSHPEASACLLFLRRDRIKKKKKNRIKKVSPVIKADWRSISSYGSRSCNHPPTGTTELIPAWGDKPSAALKGWGSTNVHQGHTGPATAYFTFTLKQVFFVFCFVCLLVFFSSKVDLCCCILKGRRSVSGPTCSASSQLSVVLLVLIGKGMAWSMFAGKQKVWTWSENGIQALFCTYRLCVIYATGWGA